jgi:hypothetical protein
MDDQPAHLEWVEHLGKAVEAFIREVKTILPEETREHLRGSRKEFLLAVRSLVDRQIEKLEKESQSKARRVEVQ